MPFLETLFQFHKVRLKVVHVGGGNHCKAKFQFHKVRLKVAGNLYPELKPTLVSIPQGTIKSFPLCVIYNVFVVVSIPQGTIKS